MGGNASTSYDTTTIATAAENVAISLTEQCTLTQDDNQTINAIVANGNITISCPTIDITDLSNTIDGSGTYTCLNTSVTGTQLMNDVAQLIGGDFKNSASGILANSSVNVGSYTYTSEEINTFFNNYATCLNSISNNQTVTSLQSEGNIDITCDSSTGGIIDISKLANNQTNNVISNCTNNLQNEFSVSNSLEQSVSPDVTQSATGLSLGDIFGIVFGLLAALILIPLFIRFMGYMFNNNNSSNNNNNNNNNNRDRYSSYSQN